MISLKTARTLLGDDAPICDSELTLQVQGLTSLAYGLLDLSEVTRTEEQPPKTRPVDVESKYTSRKTHEE